MWGVKCGVGKQSSNFEDGRQMPKCEENKAEQKKKLGIAMRTCCSYSEELSESDDRAEMCAVYPEETWHWERWLDLNRSGKKDSADSGLHIAYNVGCCCCCCSGQLGHRLTGVWPSHDLFCICSLLLSSPGQWQLGRGSRNWKR